MRDARYTVDRNFSQVMLEKENKNFVFVYSYEFRRKKWASQKYLIKDAHLEIIRCENL